MDCFCGKVYVLSSITQFIIPDILMKYYTGSDRACPVLILFLLMLTVLNGCGFFGPSPRPDAEPGDEIYFTAESAFRSQSYKKALTLYNEYLSRYPDGKRAADVLMREGEIYLRNRDYATARKVYRYLLDRYRQSSRYDDAQARILMSWYSEGNYSQVFSLGQILLDRVRDPAAFSRICQIMGDSYTAVSNPAEAVYYYAKSNESGKSADKYFVPKIKAAIGKLRSEDIIPLLGRVKDPLSRDYLMYRLGLAEMEEKRPEDALRTLSQFVTISPGHENAADARKLISELESRYREGTYGPHRIACLLPLSGAYELYGNKAQRGVELAMAQSGAGDSVAVFFKDTASDPLRAESLMNALAEENISAIIGPIISVEKAAPAAQQMGIPMIALTQKSHVTETGDFIFRNFITPQMQVQTVVSYAVKNLGIRSFAMLYPEEKYGETFLQLFRDEVAAQGGSLTAAVSYHVKMNDFRGPIRSLARHRDFDALYIPDGPRKAGLIIPQLAFYNVKKVVLLGSNLWHSEEMLEMAGRFVQGALMPDVFFAESTRPRVADFVRLFEESYGERPGFIEALAYDSAMILLKIFKDPYVENAGDVRNALAALQNYPGVTGITSFDESGEARKQLYLLRIEGSRFVEIFP